MLSYGFLPNPVCRNTSETSLCDRPDIICLWLKSWVQSSCFQFVTRGKSVLCSCSSLQTSFCWYLHGCHLLQAVSVIWEDGESRELCRPCLGPSNGLETITRHIRPRWIFMILYLMSVVLTAIYENTLAFISEAYLCTHILHNNFPLLHTHVTKEYLPILLTE